MKILKYIGIAFFIGGVLFAMAYFIKSNSKSIIEFETEIAKKRNIETKTVATGKVVPEDEIEIKPQISGIIEELFIEEGDLVKNGDLLAKIKVVPNEQALNSSKGRLDRAKIVLKNAEIEYKRNLDLYDKKVISKKEMEMIQLNYDQAKQEVSNAFSDLQIIRLGSVGGSSVANTNIRSTVDGTILEIPVKKGQQVTESNNFNPGTTIATIADLNMMIFEGKVDESEVAKLKVGMPLEVNLGAIQNQKFKAKLRFIAPKGNEENGAVKFKIEGDVSLDGLSFIRAGYSANASLVLEKKDSVLSISEAILQFDRKTGDSYVEVEVGDQKFERKNIKIGISDGINVEIISGIDKDDKIKVWNKTEPLKDDFSSEFKDDK
tara:strand:- start:4021 stop:5151 length:1131 start_codon:yes stop_codon:yes gene_type:complete